MSGAPPFARTVVVGTSCSGKTTLAARLAELWGVRHIELDQLYWLPAWTERPAEDFRALVREAAQDERWVACGNYSKARDVLWSRATDVVWLNYSFPLVFSRALKRTTGRVLTRRELFAGNRETIRKSFFSHDSILLWVVKTHGINRERYGGLSRSPEWAHLRFHEQRSPRDTERFLAELSRGA